MTRPGWPTLPARFEAAVRKAGDGIAMRVERQGRWVEIGYPELDRRTRNVARALVAMGLAPGDRVAILARSRPEWGIADLGILRAGLVTVPIYPTLPADQVGFLLRDSGARAIFVEDRAQLGKLEGIRPGLPDLARVIGLDDGEYPEGTLDLAGFEAGANGDPGTDSELERRRAALGAEDLASIVYTSGTTGEPKGVMLSHRNFSHNVAAADALVEMTPGDHHLSFLPLSHVLERTVGFYVPIFEGATISYSTQEDLRRHLVEVRPTFMTSVPRMYEKIRAGAMEKAAAAGGLTQRIFEWAVGVGKLRAAEIQGGPAPGLLDRLRLALADLLVFRKIRAATGGRLRYFVCGGAPLHAEIAEFFLGAGLRILEGYGLTETAPMLSANTPECLRLGTVGRPVSGVEIRIADDGEILARGPNVMVGYFGKPEATREVIDPEGWFHTGDIGEFTSEGCLRITDRKKNLLVLSNGKNVAPAPIEARALGCPWVAQAVALGDDRNYVTLLLVPNWVAFRGKAASLALGDDPEALASDPEVVRVFAAEIRERTRDLPHHEQPKRITLLARELSEAAGELTPTLKVKRKIVLERYREPIEAMYAGGGGEVGT